MNTNEIVSIIIYVLAGGLTVSIFKYWKSKSTELRHIKRVLLWIVVAFVALIALGCIYIFAIEEPSCEFSFGNLIDAVWQLMQLPMFSFVYFMLFIGIIYIFRERRRKMLKDLSDKPKKKKNKKLE